jgi:hypothetical protein
LTLPLPGTLQRLITLARAVLLAVGLTGLSAALAQTSVAPLVLETRIPLGQVRGRIDHLAIDAKRRRLFVAELGNDSLAVVDLGAGKLLRTIAGFSEPRPGRTPRSRCLSQPADADGTV